MKKFLLVSTLVLLSACGTIIGGTSTVVNIQTSDGESVKAQVVSKNGVQDVTLPTSVMVKRGSKPINITVKDKCYKSTEYSIPSTLNLWFLGDFITGGTTGTTTDILTGGLWDYSDVAVVPVVPNGTCKIAK